MMDPSTIHRQSGSVALAVLLSLVSTVIVGGMLYYTLKRYEVAQALQVRSLAPAGTAAGAPFEEGMDTNHWLYKHMKTGAA